MHLYLTACHLEWLLKSVDYLLLSRSITNRSPIPRVATVELPCVVARLKPEMPKWLREWELNDQRPHTVAASECWQL